MKSFILGAIMGGVLTASFGLAGSMYDRDGQPAAPRGSVQQFDYFRQRQQFLDIQGLRRQTDRDRLERQVNPCAK